MKKALKVLGSILLLSPTLFAVTTGGMLGWYTGEVFSFGGRLLWPVLPVIFALVGMFFSALFGAFLNGYFILLIGVSKKLIKALIKLNQQTSP